MSLKYLKHLRPCPRLALGVAAVLALIALSVATAVLSFDELASMAEGKSLRAQIKDEHMADFAPYTLAPARATVEEASLQRTSF